jgi:SAM-dependent methyltransferase
VTEYSELRYLLSKRSVDDRALHRGVLDALQAALGELERPLRVLEVGAGAGTMLPRLAEWGVLSSAEYTLVDRDGAALAEARQHFERSGAVAPVDPERLRFSRGSAVFDVRFVHADATAFLADPKHAHSFELVTANAVLDLMHLPSIVPALWRALTPGGLYWFTINFDGETIFLPEHPLDASMMRAYHRTMDERTHEGRPSGDSRSGRHLLELLPKTGACLLAAGSSDWVVFPRAGGYVEDEAYFLHHIVHTIDRALTGSSAVEAQAFTDWIRLRHAQIESAELIYIAHQLDTFGRGPMP